MRAMVMTYSLAKLQRQRSVGAEGRVETNGRTEVIGTDCVTCDADMVANERRRNCSRVRGVTTAPADPAMQGGQRTQGAQAG